MIKLMAFDMDGVLLRHRNSWEKVFSNLFSYNDYTFQGLSRRNDISIPREIDIKRHISKSFDLNDINKDLYMLYNFKKETKIKMVIISAGVNAFAEKLSDIYNFDNFIANDIIESNGRLRFVKNVDPNKKDINLEHFLNLYRISPEETISIGDTIFDVSMRRKSKYFIAFNPYNSKVIENADFTAYNFNDLIEIVNKINCKINVEF